jgi:hypothetical protein
MSYVSDNEILHFIDNLIECFLVLEGVIFWDKCDSECDSYPKTILFDEKKLISNV